MTQRDSKVLTAQLPIPLPDQDQSDERSRLTREALDDVDCGRVIDHQAVQAWADSLGTDNPLPVPVPP